MQNVGTTNRFKYYISCCMFSMAFSCTQKTFDHHKRSQIQYSKNFYKQIQPNIMGTAIHHCIYFVNCVDPSTRTYWVKLHPLDFIYIMEFDCCKDAHRKPPRLLLVSTPRVFRPFGRPSSHHDLKKAMHPAAPQVLQMQHAQDRTVRHPARRVGLQGVF